MKAEQRGVRRPTHAGLQVQEDLAFNRREWIIQRAGWFLLALLIVAAACGLLGKGFLSNASSIEGPLKLDYERFERVQRPTKIRLTLSVHSGERARILIGQDYLDAVRIERVVPEPESVQADARGLIYQFHASGEPTVVTWHFQPERFGVLAGTMSVPNGPVVSWTQLVYP